MSSGRLGKSGYRVTAQVSITSVVNYEFETVMNVELPQVTL